MKKLPIRDDKNKRIFDAIIDDDGELQQIEIKNVKGEHLVSADEIRKQIAEAIK